jgi:hypothetical protein
MSSLFCTIDDKHVPLYRIAWLSQVPHFCGDDDCQHEGDYEVRLDCGDSVWATVEDRDAAMQALEDWQAGIDPS